MNDTQHEITPTSDEQFRATRQRRIAAVERIRPGILAVPLRMSGGFLPYSIAYLIRDVNGDIHVVDPGSDVPGNRTRLWNAITDAGGSLRSIIVTHLHSDHLGLAASLHDASGAPVVMHEAEVAALAFEAADDRRMRAIEAIDAWGVPSLRRDELLRVADESTDAAPPNGAYRVVLGSEAVVDVPGIEVEAINAPGHTAGSIVLNLPRAGVVITGDLVLPHIHSGIGLGGTTGNNPLTDYLMSLDRVADLGDPEVLPGHGYRFMGLAGRVASLRAHHLRRAEQVARVTERHPGDTIWEVASRVSWTAGWQNMRDFFLFSALRQTQMYLDFAVNGGLAEFASEKEGT